MVYSFQETTFFKSGVYTIRSFFTWHPGSLFHVENNETAATLVCKENPVWIVLVSHVKTESSCFEKIFIDADHVSENDSYMMILYQKR